MGLSSKLPVAVHILALLACGKDEFVKSDAIAGSVNTNSAVVRRILAMLNKAGIVTAQSGSNGGSKLSVPPEKISLLDVYNAVEDIELFSIHSGNNRCNLSCGLKEVLGTKLKKAEDALESILGKIKLSEIFKETQDKAGDLKKNR